jgi:hypothetical protein
MRREVLSRRPRAGASGQQRESEREQVADTHSQPAIARTNASAQKENGTA